MPAGGAQRGGWWARRCFRAARSMAGIFGWCVEVLPVTIGAARLSRPTLRRRRDRPRSAPRPRTAERRRPRFSFCGGTPPPRRALPAGMAVSEAVAVARRGWTARPGLAWVPVPSIAAPRFPLGPPAACPRPSRAGRPPPFAGPSPALRAVRPACLGSWCSGRSLPAAVAWSRPRSVRSPASPGPLGSSRGRPFAPLRAVQGLRLARAPRPALGPPAGGPQAAGRGWRGLGAGSGCAPAANQLTKARPQRRAGWHGVAAPARWSPE